jgi:DNA-binding NtrC family response regulator
MKRFPRIAAAQRLQTLLLLTALVAVVIGCLVMSDLVLNFRSVVISDANKSLANALRELREAEKDWSNKHPNELTHLKRDELDGALRLVSYEGFKPVIRMVEAELLKAALTEVGGNKLRAAALLRIQRRLLYEKMHEHGLR